MRTAVITTALIAAVAGGTLIWVRSQSPETPATAVVTDAPTVMTAEETVITPPAGETLPVPGVADSQDGDSLTLPDTPPAAGLPPVTLLEGDLTPRVNADGIEEQVGHIDPTVLDSLAVGRSVTLSLPDGATRTALLEDFSVQDGKVSVWRGPLQDGTDVENLIITRGQDTTWLMVSTATTSYTIRVDNHTGEAVVTNEGTGNPGLGNEPHVVPPTDEPVPPSAS
ncbi:hypothetical protein AAIA72_11430 [Hahella sp. SMD15-11]|uniref:Uncharacterized protein n=1 Tax=Thermohahella caldifontis TaxID=3142973 RepID=A0AB39UTI8_9GAMM